jgi:hypothetical protein
LSLPRERLVASSDATFGVALLVTTIPNISFRIFLAQFLAINNSMDHLVVIGPKVFAVINLELACERSS